MKQILAYRPAIRETMETFINLKEKTVSPEIQWGSDFVRRLRSFATGGKMLRGGLVCYSYQLFSKKKPSAAAIKAAAALEFAHAALLIHDDLMDHDDIRRGQPAIHYQYRMLATKQKLKNATEFSQAMTICAGDMTLVFAFELLTAAAAKAPEISALFARELMAVCAGQMQDIHLSSTPTPFKRAIYTTMEAKTASYSVALPLEMGALLAGENPKTRTVLHKLGMTAGTIFQIRDDELGVLGDSIALGKPVGADIKENKKTLIQYYLFKKASDIECRRLKTIFGNPKASEKDIQYVRKLIDQHAICTLIDREISHLQQRAHDCIDKLPVDTKAKLELRALAEFCAKRQN